MELSLWTLYAWMRERGVEAHAAISEGRAQIRSVRIGRQRSYDPEYAEVVPVKMVSGGVQYSLCLCNDMDAVYVRGAELEELVNMLTDAFAFYAAWERSLLGAAMAGAELQEILDLADAAFRRPIIIKSDGSWIYALSKGYSADVHPFWAQMERNVGRRVEDYDSIQAVSRDPDFRNVFKEKFPSVIRSPSYGGMILHANLFYGSRRIGEIIALENGRTFDPGEVYIMHSLAGIIESYIGSHYDTYVSAADPMSVLQGLIEQRGGAGENMPMLYHALEIEPGEELHVAVIVSRDHADTPMLGAIREQLRKRLKQAQVFSVQAQVVCLLHGAEGRQTEPLRSLLPGDLFSCGVSYEFFALEDLHRHYLQAAAAAEEAIARNDTVLSLYDAAYDCIRRGIAKMPELQIFLHPDAERLRRVDKAENTRYGQSLFAYLMCGGNYTDAAAFLGLHRNSLIYRMEKIRAIMRTNPDDPDNRRLLLCSFLLGGLE